MILGLDRTVRVAILGAGNLGLALADYPGVPAGRASRSSRSSTPSARKIGRRSRGRRAHPRHRRVPQDWSSATHIDIAVVAVPADSAQGVVNIAVQAGIRAILNFSPGTLKVPPGVSS